MATATRKNSVPPSPPAKEGSGSSKSSVSLPIRVFDATFRFLASVKLAVICLLVLSASLSAGTWFNSWHGLAAANEYIYRAKWFSLLLAFLAMNILCAALIRFPWKKRQTGFVITHLGLLTVIGGSWWAGQASDEGQLGMLEGQTSHQLVRTDKPAFFIKELDPHNNNRPLNQYEVLFNPGSFDWPAGRYEVVSKPKDPFKLAVKKFYINSAPQRIFVADPDGSPMARIRPKVKPPKADEFIDALSGTEQWFRPPIRGVSRLVKDIPRAQVIFTYNESHEIFDDFVNPPADPGQQGVARLRYTGKDGKERSFDVKIDDAKPGVPIALPESDLTATFIKASRVTFPEPSFRTMTGEDELKIVEFDVKKGDGPVIAHKGYASLPMIPPIIPDKDDKAPTPTALVSINYYLPPVVDPQINGRYDVIEVMGDDHGKLAYQTYVRGNGSSPGKLGPHGLLKPGQEINVTAGSDPAAMNMNFSVDDYLTSGVAKDVFVSVEAPQSKKDEQISAALVEMTVDGVTKEFWLQRSPGLDQFFTSVTFPKGMYEIAFDSDRLELGFSLTLDDFDVGFDPGTQNPSSFRSEVRLTDEEAGVKDKPASIYMNNTLDHRGWRFFQSRYERHIDPETRRPTGEFVSVFQVAKNPARELIYIGCIIVVLGAFVQFYMRAGIFTDGGKLEQERAAEKARKRLESKLGKAATPLSPTKKVDDEPLETL